MDFLMGNFAVVGNCVVRGEKLLSWGAFHLAKTD